MFTSLTMDFLGKVIIPVCNQRNVLSFKHYQFTMHDANHITQYNRDEIVVLSIEIKRYEHKRVRNSKWKIMQKQTTNNEFDEKKKQIIFTLQLRHFRPHGGKQQFCTSHLR